MTYKAFTIKAVHSWIVFFLCLCVYNTTEGQNINLTTLKPITQEILNKRGENFAFTDYTLFSKISDKSLFDPKVLTSSTTLSMDRNTLKNIVSNEDQAIRMTLPFQNQEITLLMVKTEVFADGFNTFTNEGDRTPVAYKPGVYYRGIIEGDLTSLVALSFFQDDVIGMASSDRFGNITINKSEIADQFMIYSDRDLQVKNPGQCGTEEPENYSDEIRKVLESGVLDTRDQKCVKMYIECDYALYLNKGSVTNVNNWISAVYNNIAALYANESILTQISETFVWVSADPYNINSSYTALTKFKQLRPSFNGDLAHLAALGGNNIGGIAWVNSLCSAFKYAYSNIYATYSNVPVYSWTIEVMTHEIGHNLGSPHTHSCTWPGGALDNCYPVEGTCNPGPPPTTGGTIMSYCHLTSYGINFNNGFGTLPGNLIRTKVSAAACLGTCEEGGDLPCEAPTSVSITGITNNTAQVSWTNALDAISYRLEYKTLAATTWSVIDPIFATTRTLTGLLAGTTYQVRLKTNCDGETSPYGGTYNFTTGNTCAIPTGLYVENITSTQARVKWTPVSGATEYDLRYKLSSSSTWNTFTVSSTTVDFSGLTPSTSYDVNVRSRCGSVLSDYCQTVTFITDGDNNQQFCSSYGLKSSLDWIESMSLDAFSNVSGNNSGYGNFLAMTPIIKAGTNSLFTCVAGMGMANTHYWTIWMDYNRDGDFSESNEKVMQFITNNSNTNYIKLNVPLNITPGPSYMRVSMKRGGFPDACEVFAFGEVEDYGLIINPPGFAPGQSGYTLSSAVYPNPFTDLLNVEFLSEKSTDILVQVINTQGAVVVSKKAHTTAGHNMITIEETDHLADGVYIVKVKGHLINETHKVTKIGSGR